MTTVGLLIVLSMLSSCARSPLVLSGRYQVENAFSTHKQWMEFEGSRVWQLGGGPDDGQYSFSIQRNIITFSQLAGFEAVRCRIRVDGDGSILLYLLTDSGGGADILDSLVGASDDDPGSGEIPEIVQAFNRSLRGKMTSVFKESPFMRLSR